MRNDAAIAQLIKMRPEITARSGVSLTGRVDLASQRLVFAPNRQGQTGLKNVIEE